MLGHDAVSPSERSGPAWISLRYSTDQGIGARAQIGMVVLSNDQTLSYEARSMLDVPGVALFESRMHANREPNQALTVEQLSDTSQIEGAVRLINSSRSPDVVALGCTSAAMIIGPGELGRRIREVYPGVSVTDPFSAITAGLRALRVRSIAFISPYPAGIAQDMIDRITASGVEVLAAGLFERVDGNVIEDAPFVSRQSIERAVRQVTAEVKADAVVIACTQMRAAEMVDDLERSFGIPVLTSNQAMCWHALRLAGCQDALRGWGRLFDV